MSPRNSIVLNKGSQYNYVNSEARHAAYLGGVGAGKSFALVCAGLKHVRQPTPVGEDPAKFCFTTISLPVLKDILYPVVEKVLTRAGIDYKYVERSRKVDRAFILNPNERDGGQWFIMRSMDQPERIRGIEIAGFGIDEGRNFKDREAYKVLIGRLRQGGVQLDADGEPVAGYVPGLNYRHIGRVSSTPNGHDWQYHSFHENGKHRYKDAQLFNASVYDNRTNLPPEYIPDLEANWEGRYADQEIRGLFIAQPEGAVYGLFDESLHVQDITYNPDLPLYSFWDYGIGDYGVCGFAQLAWNPKTLSNNQVEFVPSLRILDVIEMRNKTAAEWADAYWKWLDENVDGRLPTSSWGDPAGRQRGPTGASWMEALRKHGVHINPAPIKPKEQAIIIISNLIEGTDRFIVSSSCNPRFAEAVQQYHFKVDADGNRLSQHPVHDDSSHINDAVQYLVNGVVGLHARRRITPTAPAARGTMQHIVDQLTAPKGPKYVGNNQERKVDWSQDQPVSIEDLVNGRS